ncbi:hypothetical protein AGMMS50212_11610 [Spirochaetia bacterium]|nr:hypothetical protein AGMMS50212_11610 [Spirochaetia bacterium]
MAIESIIAVASLIVGLFGIICTILSINSYKKLKKETKTIKWTDIPNIADFVFNKCKEISFVPDIILGVSANNYHLAKFISAKFPNDPIILNGFVMNKKLKSDKIPEKLKNEYYKADGNIFNIFFPKDLFKDWDYKVLLISSFVKLVRYGDLLKPIKDYLKDQIPDKNVKSFCLAITESALNHDVGVDFYWKKISTDDKLYLPWGEAIR